MTFPWQGEEPSYAESNRIAGSIGLSPGGYGRYDNRMDEVIQILSEIRDELRRVHFVLKVDDPPTATGTST